VRDLTAANPAEVFDLPNKGRVAEGYDADLVLVDPAETHLISGARLHTNCDWTPFDGREGVFPELVTVRGTPVYERDSGVVPGSDLERFAEPVGRNVRSAGDEADECDD
jgi:dihydroorotase